MVITVKIIAPTPSDALISPVKRTAFLRTAATCHKTPLQRVNKDNARAQAQITAKRTVPQSLNSCSNAHGSVKSALLVATAVIILREASVNLQAVYIVEMQPPLPAPKKKKARQDEGGFQRRHTKFGQ